MTLIVYKDDVLAGDSRSSAVHVSIKDYSCAHCAAPSKPIHDSETSSKLYIPIKRCNAMFENQTLLAFGLAGDAKKSLAVANILRHGKDLKQAQDNYLALRSPHEKTTDYGCIALMVCETNLFIVDIPSNGPLKIEKLSRDKFAAIGSGRGGARWMNTLMPDLTAVNIINLVMADDITVGGDIDMIDFDVDIPHKVKGEKGDPKQILFFIQQSIIAGRKLLSKTTQKQGETK